MAGAPPLGGFRAVATDLDGTLLRSDLTVSGRTRAALAAAAAAGARHVVVTGRSAAGTAPFLTALGYRGLAVCGQGGQLYDADAGRLLCSAELDHDLVRHALDRLTARIGPLELAVVTGGLDGAFFATPGFDAAAAADWRIVSEPDLWRRPVAKVLLRRPGCDDDTLSAVAADVCGGDLVVVHAGPRLVEILPAGVDKAAGLAAAAAEAGFTAAQTIAFGDMPNDIPMLTWAGHGVAMGNGHPRVRAEADETTFTNDQDGVAAVLERLLPAREE